MLFVIGINPYAFNGADIERSLRSEWDVSDFLIYDANRDTRLLFGIPTAIETHAEGMAGDTWQSQEAADFYIGLARGYDIKYCSPTPTRGQIRCVCLDYAFILDRFGKKVSSSCLNKTQVAHRRRGEAIYLHDNSETLESLVNVVKLLCQTSTQTV